MAFVRNVLVQTHIGDVLQNTEIGLKIRRVLNAWTMATLQVLLPLAGVLLFLEYLL